MSDEAQILEPSVSSEYWRGAISWVPDGDTWRPWRLPPERADRAHAPVLVGHAQMAAGVRAELRTDASGLSLPLTYEYDAPGFVDVTVEDALHRRVELTSGSHVLEVDLPDGEHEVRLWLPQAGHTTVGALTLKAATAVAPLAQRPRWITYGSSITQCSAAAGPSQTWPAIAATTLGWDLTCLGFGGQCHLDPIAEHAIAQTPADVISLCLGINIHGRTSFNERSFAPQISGFVERVRAAHPEATIAVITPIGCPARENSADHDGLTLVQMREAIGEVVAALNAHDGRITVIDGLSIIGTDEEKLLHDGLHPGPEGYQLMGQRLASALSALTPAPATH
ncbi:GDSL-type esterase/lipase family protein [Ruania halotolerans]|uniref:GDSL-type esterase/lipase family protein n=1 Tax=Ruania halotolerans TaxID=2897773 RepID=UPI001E29B174|nr:GDSL-type esterase/lipase family protein [Ruania halotolerans]UFU06008.1 GDSL-type esterase/lipase family protein [Ruania halotolerans]